VSGWLEPVGDHAARGAPARGEGTAREPPGVPAGWRRLPRSACARPTPDLARALLGRIVVRRDRGGALVAGRIVETEAYGDEDDRASHARAGRTPRTAPMFGPPGHAYVYLVYGLHHCLNVVAEEDGVAGAVLIRALEPLLGADEMRRRRGRAGDPSARLAAGPARLCQALAIDRRLDGVDLSNDTRLWLAEDERAAVHTADPGVVVRGPRIGVGYAGPPWDALPWRFGLRDHPSLSRPFPAGD
jgi:DNA-3-methyladenine glycosylase